MQSHRKATDCGVNHAQSSAVTAPATHRSAMPRKYCHWRAIWRVQQICSWSLFATSSNACTSWISSGSCCVPEHNQVHASVLRQKCTGTTECRARHGQCASSHVHVHSDDSQRHSSVAARSRMYALAYAHVHTHRHACLLDYAHRHHCRNP